MQDRLLSQDYGAKAKKMSNRYFTDRVYAIFITAPGAMGMIQAVLGWTVPTPRCRCWFCWRASPCSPSSQWEAVAGVAFLPRSHRVRNCRLPAFRRSLIAQVFPVFAASLFRSCVESVPASWSIRFSRCLREGAGITPYTKHVFGAGFTIPFSAFSKSLQLYLWLF